MSGDPTSRDEAVRARTIQALVAGQDSGLRSPLSNAEVTILAEDVLRLVAELWQLHGIVAQSRVSAGASMSGDPKHCPACGREPLGSYRPNPTTKYLCPYCNFTARLRDEGVIVDSFGNVCHEACLSSAVAGRA